VPPRAPTAQIPSIKATLRGASVAPGPPTAGDRPKPSAPLAPKAPVAAKPIRQPSSPDIGQAPLPPWRILPDANAPEASEAPPPRVDVPPAVSTQPLLPQATTPVAPPVAAQAATPIATPAAPVATPVETVPFAAATRSPEPPPVAQHAAPPPLTQAAHEPARALRESAGYDDPRPLIRAAIDEAMVPVHQALRDLVRRVEELERRPATIVQAAPAQPAALVQSAASPAVRTAMRQPMPSYPPPVGHALPTHGPTLDLAAINRDTSIQVDDALDGSKRKRRLALTFVLLLLVVFGGLFGALAHSYTPHGSSSSRLAPALDRVALVAPSLASFSS
jgi:hypothetical protein